MKSKRNTYLLLASVTIIWGIIGYKIVNTLSRDQNTSETEVVLTDFKPKALQQQDKFSISEHRRDPFLGNFVTPRRKNMRSGMRKSKPKPEAPPIPISFSGMISGKTVKEHIFFVSVNNRQHVMNINDEVQGVKLVKGNAAAISVRYNDQLKTIPITE